YTPTVVGHHVITGTYGGDGIHTGSTGSFTILSTLVVRTTSTTVSCTTPVTVGQTSTCTVTVTDTNSGTFVTPTGTVSLFSTLAGTFTPCNLSGSTASATCTSTYTTQAAGSADRKSTRLNSSHLGT